MGNLARKAQVLRMDTVENDNGLSFQNDFGMK